MAAPTNAAALVKKRPCQLGAVHTLPDSDIGATRVTLSTLLAEIGCRGILRLVSLPLDDVSRDVSLILFSLGCPNRESPMDARTVSSGN